MQEKTSKGICVILFIIAGLCSILSMIINVVLKKYIPGFTSFIISIGWFTTAIIVNRGWHIQKSK